jgi:hypothetical protein
VSAFVEADWCEAGCGPGRFGVERDRARVERSCVVVIGEEEAVAAFALAEAVVEQFAAEAGGDRDAAAAAAALRCDESALAVPALLDVDQVSLEVDLVPGECLQFAEA